jgi:nucleotide-binding universal stress UspA family protein
MLDQALDLATAFDATLQVVHFSNSRTDAGVGKPTVNVVEDGDYERVVMGHYGSGAGGRAIFGSAAETVVRSESVPVTVIS